MRPSGRPGRSPDDGARRRPRSATQSSLVRLHPCSASSIIRGYPHILQWRRRRRRRRRMPLFRPGRGRLCVMTVLVWITDDTWAACVDAARRLAPADQGITLLHVTDSAAADAARGAFTGLLGRAGRDPGAQLEAMADSAATELLDAAAARLGRAADRVRRHGRPEHQVTEAARGASLLVVAREGGEGGRSEEHTSELQS